MKRAGRSEGMPITVLGAGCAGGVLTPAVGGINAAEAAALHITGDRTISGIYFCTPYAWKTQVTLYDVSMLLTACRS